MKKYPSLWNAFRDGAQFKLGGGRIVTMKSDDAGSLALPSGRMVASDHLLDPWQEPFTVSVAPDRYPIHVALGDGDVALVMDPGRDDLRLPHLGRRWIFSGLLWLRRPWRVCLPGHRYADRIDRGQASASGSIPIRAHNKASVRLSSLTGVTLESMTYGRFC